MHHYAILLLTGMEYPYFTSLVPWKAFSWD